MKQLVYICCLWITASLPAAASALGTSALSVIPADTQQVIVVDYRSLNDSPTALALKARVLPDRLKEFEDQLRGVGIDPGRDVDQLAFASFRSKGGLRVMGIAQGQFQLHKQKVLAQLRRRKITGQQYRGSFLYPMTGGLEMVFLDGWSTMVFGDDTTLKMALDTRDGQNQDLNSNSQLDDMMNSVESGTVWSVLDALGTQNVMQSALADAAKLTDYQQLKPRLLGSRYSIDFGNGVDFQYNVDTADGMTALTLSSLMKAGILYKQASASPVEKAALDNLVIDADNSGLKVRFRTDAQRFQSLLQTELFAAVSR